MSHTIVTMNAHTGLPVGFLAAEIRIGAVTIGYRAPGTSRWSVVDAAESRVVAGNCLAAVRAAVWEVTPYGTERARHVCFAPEWARVIDDLVLTIEAGDDAEYRATARECGVRL